MPRKAGRIIQQKRSREIAALNDQHKSDRTVRLKSGHVTVARKGRNGNRPLKAVHTGLHPMPTINFVGKMRRNCISISRASFARVDRNHRPHVVAGGSLPGSWQTYIVPVPTEVITYLPPVPEGYQLGFYYGYIIVYDPYSGLVLDVIDLFTY